MPASFLLAAAANPCPCGWLGSGMRECTCGRGAIERYRARLSGPLLDRIDLHVTVGPVSLRELRRGEPAEASAAIRDRVTAARQRQRARLARWKLHCNAEMTSAVLRASCRLDDVAERELARVVGAAGAAGAAGAGAMSARAIDRLIRVARTLADLAERDAIDASCIREAAALRAIEAPAEPIPMSSAPALEPRTQP
jgi:magnesium chelatase family protein